VIQLPLIDENDFLLEAVLDDITYFLRFSWNSEAAIWVLGIEDANKVDVLQGVVLVPSVALLVNFRHYAVPAGEFVAYSDNDLAQIGRQSFLDGTFQLYYLTKAEYAAL
jgi:hypothetical protein